MPRRIEVPPMRVKRPMQPVQNNTVSNKVAKLDVPNASKPPSSNLVAKDNQPKTITEDIIRLEAKIKLQEIIIARQKVMLEERIRMQDEVNAKQKAMFVAKIQMQEEVITEQKEKVQMQDEIITKQKVMFEAKIQMQDKIIAEAKNQVLESEKLEHEKLMSRFIKCKIAELKVQVESGNPDYEVIRSMGRDINLVMQLIPESLRVIMEAQFSFQYVELKSLSFARINASEWERIESELLKIRDY